MLKVLMAVFPYTGWHGTMQNLGLQKNCCVMNCCGEPFLVGIRHDQPMEGRLDLDFTK
jgi:hypothetical protein